MMSLSTMVLPAHLVCLLLLIVSSPLLISAEQPAAVGPQVNVSATQRTCLSGCDASVSNIITTEESPKTISSDVTNAQNQSSSPGFNVSTSNNNSHISEKEEQAHPSKVELEGNPISTQKMQSSQHTASDLSHTVSSKETASSLSTPEQAFTTSSSSSSSTQQQASIVHQPPSAATQPGFTTTDLSTQLAHPGPSMSPARSATVPPVTSTHTFTTTGSSMDIKSPQSTSPTEAASTHTTATEELPHPPTTLQATASTTVTRTKTSPSLGVTSAPSAPAMQTTTPPNKPTDFLRNSSSTSHRKSSSSTTRVAVVEAAGGALTRQLADTASLMAVLLFGLLFFLVTVAVFVTQAYESYRRKDYTQVDYLINGMYIDSGV